MEEMDTREQIVKKNICVLLLQYLHIITVYRLTSECFTICVHQLFEQSTRLHKKLCAYMRANIYHWRVILPVLLVQVCMSTGPVINLDQMRNSN